MITMLRHSAERLLIAGLMKVVTKISWEQLPMLATPLARFLWVALPRRQAITVDNLQKALHLSQPEATKMAKGVFRHFVLTALEFLRLGDAPKEAIAKVHIHGLEEAKAAWQLKQGLIIVTGHLGNFELMGARLAQEFPIWVIARPQSPAVWKVIKDIRERAGMKVLEKFGSVREALHVLRHGEVLGMLADQHAGEGAGTMVIPFFGRPASVFKTPALLAARTGVPIVFGYDVRLADGYHKVVLLPPKEIRSDEVESATIWLCKELEKAILQTPEQWWWLHDRWKVARQQTVQGSKGAGEQG